MSTISKKVSTRLIYCLFFVITTMGVLTANAQGNPGNDPDFPDIPLDGGLSILLVAGAAYGSKKLYDKNKK